MTDIPLTVVHALFMPGACPVHVSSAIVATGLTFCSVTVVAAIGWGGAAACALAVCVHLTLLPALLVVLGPCCCMPLVNCRCTSEVCVALCRAVCAVGGCGGGGGGNRGRGHCQRRSSDIEVVTSSMHDSLLDQRNLFTNSGEDDVSFSTSNMSAKTAKTGKTGKTGKMERRTTTTVRTFVPQQSSVSVWIVLGQWCRRHRKTITFAMCVALAPFVWLCSQAKISVNQELLTPSNSKALASMKDISKYGLNAGWLNIVR